MHKILRAEVQIYGVFISGYFTRIPRYERYNERRWDETNIIPVRYIKQVARGPTRGQSLLGGYYNRCRDGITDRRSFNWTIYGDVMNGLYSGD
jgi:hypothetical protein